MIKFFRKIRQKMLTENKFSKYLIYAIGEILLVVIGILIALYINNWNQKQIEKKQMQSFLLSFKENLIADTLQYGHTIKFYDTLVNNKNTLLKKTHSDTLSANDIYEMILPRISNFKINSTTFDKITSAGITQISENENLSKKMYVYYTIGDAMLNDLSVWDLNTSNDEANYWHNEQNIFEININAYALEESHEIINFQDESINKKNIFKLLSEPKGRNHLKIAYARKQVIIKRLKGIKVLASELIGEIENEIND